MKTTLLLITSLFIITSCDSKQSSNNKAKNANTYVNKLFPEGTYKFEILDSVKSTPEMERINSNLMIAYQENKEEFDRYFEKIRNNQEAEFPSSLIISEYEFQKYMEFADNIELLPSETVAVEVKYENEFIILISSGKLDILNYFSYNTTNNSIRFNGEDLKFEDSVHITDPNNAFKEPWKGHQWTYFEPKDLSEETMPSDIESLKQMEIKAYDIIIGELLESNRAFIKIQAKHYKDGLQVTDIHLPLRVKKDNM